MEPQLQRAAQALREGRLVAFPTETVYGLGAHALDERAVAGIFEAKGRPRFDPLIVHVLDLQDAMPLIQPSAESLAMARKLAERFWPGPLTLVLPKSERVPDIVTAGQPTVAIRAPAHPMARALLRTVQLPLAAPSANRFTKISPTCAAHVAEQLQDRVAMILDGGSCEVGLESTIVSLVEPPYLLLRPGGLPLEELEPIIGALHRPGEHEHTRASPGRQMKHYAPQTRMVLMDPKTIGEEAQQAGLLSFGPSPEASRFAAAEVLSAGEDLREAAAGLFAAMRRLDAKKLPLIVAEPVPERGLGLAIMDRLRRACAKHG